MFCLSFWVRCGISKLRSWRTIILMLPHTPYFLLLLVHWTHRRPWLWICCVTCSLMDRLRHSTSLWLSPVLAPTSPQAQGNHWSAIHFPSVPSLPVVWCRVQSADYCCVRRYEGHLREASFSIGLQGISDSDILTVKEVIWKTFKEVAEWVRKTCICLLHAWLLVLCSCS